MKAGTGDGSPTRVETWANAATVHFGETEQGQMQKTMSKLNGLGVKEGENEAYVTSSDPAGTKRFATFIQRFEKVE